MVIGCRSRCRRCFESHIISQHENMKFNNNKGKKNAQLSIQKRETNNLQQLLEINEGYIQLMHWTWNWLLSLINTVLKRLFVASSLSISLAHFMHFDYDSLPGSEFNNVICVVSWITYTQSHVGQFIGFAFHELCTVARIFWMSCWNWNICWRYVIGCMRFREKGLFEVSMESVVLYDRVCDRRDNETQNKTTERTTKKKTIKK